MKRFMNKKVVTIGAAIGLALGIAGTATAYWLSSGGGSGTATTATAGNSNLTVASTEASPGTMGPNIGPEALTVTITNPGTDTQSSYVTSVTAKIDTAQTFNTGCAAGDYQLASSGGAAYTNSSHTAADGGGTQTVTVPVGVELAPGHSTTATVYIGFVDLTDVTNANADQTGCEGQSVLVDYTTA